MGRAVGPPCAPKTWLGAGHLPTMTSWWIFGIFGHLRRWKSSCNQYQSQFIPKLSCYGKNVPQKKSLIRPSTSLVFTCALNDQGINLSNRVWDGQDGRGSACETLWISQGQHWLQWIFPLFCGLVIGLFIF